MHSDAIYQQKEVEGTKSIIFKPIWWS